MDCRTSLLLAVCLTLAGTVGCVTDNSSVQRGAPMPTPPPTPAPIAPTPPPVTPPSLTTPTPGITQPLAKLSEADKTKSMIHLKMAEATYRMSQARDEKNDREQANQWDEARKIYQLVLKLDPKHLPAYQGLTQAYLKMGEKDRALAAINHALTLAPHDPYLLYDQAVCHLCRREWNEAQRSLSEALQIQPENRLFMKQLGFVLARAGDFDRSIELLARFYRDPGYAHYMVAKMLDQVGQEEACKQHLRLALQANPNLAGARTILEEMEHPGAAAARAQASQASQMQFRANEGSGILVSD